MLTFWHKLFGIMFLLSILCIPVVIICSMFLPRVREIIVGFFTLGAFGAFVAMWIAEGFWPGCVTFIIMSIPILVADLFKPKDPLLNQ